MRISFESWVQDQNFNSNTKFLFDECFKSYRGQAYSAALMYTHLAFYESIRNKILKVDTPPKNITLQNWDNQFLKKIRNTDIWDKEIFDFLNQENDTPKRISIFELSCEIREELKYWRNKRNSAVHFKSEKLNHFHVEGYWNFIETHYNLIHVIESKDNIFKRIETFFDIELTRPNEDYIPLLNSTKDLFNSQDNNSLNRLINLCTSNNNHRLTSFLCEIIIKYSTLIQEQVDNIFNKEENIDLLYTFLKINNQILNCITLSNITVRRLWRQKLFKDGYNDFSLLSLLNAKKYISSIDCNEILEYLKDTLINQNFFPGKDYIQEMQKFGYYIYFEQLIFSSDLEFNWDFKFMNRNEALYIHFLENFEIQDRWLTIIFNQLAAPYTPTDFNRTLFEFLRRSAIKKQQVITFINESKYSLMKVDKWKEMLN